MYFYFPIPYYLILDFRWIMQTLSKFIILIRSDNVKIEAYISNTILLAINLVNGDERNSIWKERNATLQHKVGESKRYVTQTLMV